MSEISNPELDKINDAIKKLNRSKVKMSIKSIATKSGVSRRTIYRRNELKVRCLEAMGIENDLKIAKEEIAATTMKKKRYTITEKYERIKIELATSKTANEMLLENNRQLVIEKQRLLARQVILEARIEDMRNKNVKTIR